jgi:hypothetical protein
LSPTTRRQCRRCVVWTGVGSTPAIAINPTTLTFSTVLGQTSAVQNITVSNAGGGTLNVSGAALAAANAATWS